MDGNDDARREWIERVLGYSLPGGRTNLVQDDDDAPAEPIEIYEHARTEVANSLAALASAMRERGDSLLDRIADYGLLGLTEGQHVALTKSLLAYLTTGEAGRAAAAEQVKAAVAAYRARLGEQIFAELDGNPFGIDVGWTTVLDGALAEIAAAVG